MKTKKIDLANIQKVLSRDEMKKVTAGSGNDCQGSGANCNTSQALNCCNGFICADYKCYKKT